MAGGDRVSADKRQSGKYKLTFLVCLGVVFALHVRAEDIDLGVSKGNLLAIRLLHQNVTAEFADLRESGHRSGRNKNGNRKRSVKVSANHLKIPPSCVGLQYFEERS